ncbi:MAG TPA: chaperone modulator CbpM [Usitatibacter sp.]|nr:chaperone modulator CbpM [Usitatibacter sp.]
MAEDDAVWLHAERVISIVELATYSGLSEEAVRELVDYGALRPAQPAAEPPAFSADCAAQVRSAVRLCSDLELEPATVPLVLSLLERIHDLELRVQRLSAQLSDWKPR